MTRDELINRLMSIDLGILGIVPTKGDLKKLPDRELAQLLTNFDAVKNAQYSSQRILPGCTK